ncbi:HNH endonuclease [Kangiella sp. TOML190]|uniref:HNH endonuclease n=1 Tax=Kangiella sp. TOML190 TaxID=2931351 RepID=UPI00203B5E0D|nr:HNH endonuclease signature motif containing protein [Kangiella sp. TOML190]
MDVEKFLADFQDFMAPSMDVYEQSIYIYIIRHSRLIGQSDAVIGFKSARKKLGYGVGKHKTPPSEGVCYERLGTLSEKGFIKVLGSERMGTRIHAYLPEEIPELCDGHSSEQIIDIEDMDFFEDVENRQAILEREKHECFYCRAKLTADNYIMEHVVSRPAGDNSYRNIVASCRTCNNKKGPIDAASFVRSLYRENLLSQDEFKQVLEKLEMLKKGELQPIVLSS